MMRHRRLAHQFVDSLPNPLEDGTLYVSTKYATAGHRCCCGCGAEVITPFTPTDWKMTFDGETVSLSPSVGNWNLPCRSHYVIERSRVLEAGPWSDEQVSAEWRRDRRAKGSYYGTDPAADRTEPSAPSSAPTAPHPTWVRSMLNKLKWW